MTVRVTITYLSGYGYLASVDRLPAQHVDSWLNPRHVVGTADKPRHTAVRIAWELFGAEPRRKDEVAVYIVDFASGEVRRPVVPFVP